MKAGASSMWASCCGLLNEVMGTGAVRGQQAAFGGGTGTFRFAQSSDFSPFSSSSPSNIVCKACGLAFSVFRKKHICSDCKKDFCSVCSTLQENHRRCCTCHLLKETAFQRPRLMKLKVKDLRQYLSLRNIPTDSCREKEDLVELVLCHHDSCSEEMDLGMDSSARPQTSGFFTHPFFSSPSAPSPSVSSSQGETSESLGSATTSQGTSETVSVASDTEPPEQQVELSKKRARASLSDLSTLEEIEGLTIRQLKEILARNFVNYSGCCEKWELVEKVNRLYRENEENRKSLENPDNKADSERERLQLAGNDDNLCRICMDAVIDCVLLECGHMVTCTKCGKRMSECPICRQYVVRAVHVFKS
ncbi:E3 ubiquitin-protein ligase RNF34 isoform X2 [Spea bombifrons]|uniref:E3 ubiquitin-protein ligase RNF34 isoform X2 n=1 Tax=Spea bombifrons TaxID=233779 RepID=UPI00234BAF80|nr:E3 ubiquitin-protein ligase RNF34 isoform X2 [Spea bombifrons]